MEFLLSGWAASYDPFFSGTNHGLKKIDKGKLPFEVELKPLNDVKVGDVILFWSAGPNLVVTKLIQEIKQENNEISLTVTDAIYYFAIGGQGEPSIGWPLPFPIDSDTTVAVVSGEFEKMAEFVKLQLRI